MFRIEEVKSLILFCLQNHLKDIFIKIQTSSTSGVATLICCGLQIKNFGDSSSMVEVLPLLK